MSLFEAFAIFCGIGIHNAKMYDSACKMMAKQKVKQYIFQGGARRPEKRPKITKLKISVSEFR